MVMKNPFVTNGYAGPEYFCDRVEETQHIIEMLTNEETLAAGEVFGSIEAVKTVSDAFLPVGGEIVEFIPASLLFQS